MRLRSLGRLLNAPFIASLIIVALVIPTTAMWYQSLRVNVTIKLSNSSWGITSYKGLKTIQFNWCGCDFMSCQGLESEEMALSGNKHTLTVLVNTSENYTCSGCGCDEGIHHNGTINGLWVGLVIKNDGSLPLKIRGVSVVLTSQDQPDSWSMTSYVYPQFKNGVGNKPFWGGVNCSMLPYPGYASLPTILSPDYKTVAWVHIEFNGSGVYQFKVTPVLANFNT